VTVRTCCAVSDLEGSRDELVELRHAIHQDPEIGHKEFNTARLVAGKLTAWGYEVTEGVGGTGVVGTLKAGNGARSLGIRADMDALPITEQTGLPYASRNEGLMRACGTTAGDAARRGMHLATAPISRAIPRLQPARGEIDCGAARCWQMGCSKRLRRRLRAANQPGKPCHSSRRAVHVGLDRVAIWCAAWVATRRVRQAIDPIVAASSV
jgi:hypothetical protein